MAPRSSHAAFEQLKMSLLEQLRKEAEREMLRGAPDDNPSSFKRRSECIGVQKLRSIEIISCAALYCNKYTCFVGRKPYIYKHGRLIFSFSSESVISRIFYTQISAADHSRSRTYVNLRKGFDLSKCLMKFSIRSLAEVLADSTSLLYLTLS